MYFPEEGPVAGVVSDHHDRTFHALVLGAMCWVKTTMPGHSSGFDGCISQVVYGIPSIQEV